MYLFYVSFLLLLSVTSRTLCLLFLLSSYLSLSSLSFSPSSFFPLFFYSPFAFLPPAFSGVFLLFLFLFRPSSLSAFLLRLLILYFLLSLSRHTLFFFVPHSPSVLSLSLPHHSLLRFLSPTSSVSSLLLPSTVTHLPSTFFLPDCMSTLSLPLHVLLLLIFSPQRFFLCSLSPFSLFWFVHCSPRVSLFHSPLSFILCLFCLRVSSHS